MSSGGPSPTRRALPTTPQASSIRAEVAGQRVSSSMAAYNDARTRSNAACSLMSTRPHGSYGGTHQRRVAWPHVSQRHGHVDPARREPAMLGIKSGRQPQLDNTAVRPRARNRASTARNVYEHEDIRRAVAHVLDSSGLPGLGPNGTRASPISCRGVSSKPTRSPRRPRRRDRGRLPFAPRTRR